MQEDAAEIEVNYNEELKKLVKKMLEKSPEKRITIKEILKNQLISDEIEKIKEEFDCYQKSENGKNHQISFQDYLKQKGEGYKETNPENNQYSSLKVKENSKVLLRFNSLPVEGFEICNNIKSSFEDNKVNFQVKKKRNYNGNFCKNRIKDAFQAMEKSLMKKNAMGNSYIKEVHILKSFFNRRKRRETLELKTKRFTRLIRF